MIFENIGSKFNNIFQKFKIKSGKITEKDLDEVLGQIRRVLLEADVNIRVAINIVNEIKNNAIDKEIIAGVSSEEMIIKISNDAIKLALGEKNQEEKSYDLKTDNGDKKKKEPIGFFDIQSEERIMLVGLQGSGKTTMAAKLANFINIKKKVNDTGLCSLDFYRPAAINQLKILSNRNGLKFIDINNNLILKNNEKESINDLVIKQAEDYVKSMNSNNLKRYIIDTAGRTSIDSEMMNQLIELKKIIKPTKIILVVDSMIGKSAIDIAKQFHSNLNLTGLIFTKTDSDTKAGAILSIKSLLDLPIYFLSSGEKIDDIDEFYPDRIAQRILGMGDIVSLVEKASNIMDNKDSDELKNKAAKGELDLFDLLDQLKFLKKWAVFHLFQSFYHQIW